MEDNRTLSEIADSAIRYSKAISKLGTPVEQYSPPTTLGEKMKEVSNQKDISLSEEVFWSDRDEKDREKFIKEHPEVYATHNDDKEFFKILEEFKSLHIRTDYIEYYYSKYRYFTCGMPLLYEFLAGLIDRNHFAYNLYISNINRHGLLSKLDFLRIGSNITEVVRIDPNRFKSYREKLFELGVDISSEAICQTWMYGDKEDKLFIKGNFLVIHKDIVKNIYECSFNKRELIVLLSVFRFAQSFHKETVYVQLSALPVKFTKTIFKKNLIELVKKSYLKNFLIEGDRIKVEVNPKYIVRRI